MSEFYLTAQYMFKRASLLIGPCMLMIFPGKLIAIGKIYPKMGPVANDNEAER
jgi:hypothetical protein